MSLFKDKNIASVPGFALELPMLKSRFNTDMVAWHRENSTKEEYKDQPYKYQKAFDAQVKFLMGDILADSKFIQAVYDTFGMEISKKYGIVIEPRGDAL